MRVKGLRKNDGRRNGKSFARFRSKVPSGVADLSFFTPYILNQNDVGSCVAHGVIGAAFTTLSAAGTPIDVPSPRVVYATALGVDRADDYPLRAPSAYPALSDRGTFLLTGVHVLELWGVVPIGDFVSVDGKIVTSDCGCHNFMLEPDLFELEQASCKLLVGAYELRTEIDVQIALDNNIAVAIGGFVDTSFVGYDGSSTISQQATTDTYGGGHCTYIEGYHTEPNGEVLYHGVNSWGTGWGKTGRYIADGKFIRQAWEKYALDVRVQQ